MYSADTIEIKLRRGFTHKQSKILAEVVTDAYNDLVKTKDFKELKDTVAELAGAQKELTEAQKRTEQMVENLTEAQKRTEQMVENLAEAQKRTEEEMRFGFKSLSDQIASLGSRWGIYNEATFRATIAGVLRKQKGVEVKNGYYGDREVDIIISNGEHILLEITSRLKSSDIDKLIVSGEDYEKQHGVKPVLMVATSYISPKLMQQVMGLERKIEIFSYEAE